MKILSGIRYNTLILFILFIVCVVFLCLFPYNAVSLYKDNYTFLLGGLFLCSTLLATKLKDKNLFLFDPFLFSSVLLFCIFLIQPMIDIIRNDVYYYAYVNPAYGCERGTVIFVLFYIAFYIGSCFQNKINSNSSFYRPLSPTDKNYIAFFSLVLWAVFMLFSLIFLIANGYSIGYIFSLGQVGEAHVDEIFARFGFLSKFTASMLVSLMYYWVSGRSKLLKTILFGLTLIIFLLKGGRAGILVLLSAPIIYHYIKRVKNPPIHLVVIILSIFLLMAAVVQAARWGLRSGGMVTVETTWNMETILSPMRSNFKVYNMYYLVVDAMPEKIGYLWGKESVLYTAIMLVPRTFWPTKPDAPFREILYYVAGDTAVRNGEAFPGLTEFYMDFGPTGCIICGIIFGWLVSKLKNLYMYSKSDTHGVVLYTVLYPELFQIIIRGYIPSLFISMLCIFLPYFILSLIIPTLENRRT